MPTFNQDLPTLFHSISLLLIKLLHLNNSQIQIFHPKRAEHINHLIYACTQTTQRLDIDLENNLPLLTEQEEGFLNALCGEVISLAGGRFRTYSQNMISIGNSLQMLISTYQKLKGQHIQEDRFVSIEKCNEMTNLMEEQGIMEETNALQYFSKDLERINCCNARVLINTIIKVGRPRDRFNFHDEEDQDDEDDDEQGDGYYLNEEEDEDDEEEKEDNNDLIFDNDFGYDENE
ncbi:MAG: hypothetical protein EZS28_025121 [Streblomastix strix]|uniref:Uncharacterized protein n=1 Tax=Streblomastix strix TaxID=222440 RepID=A0A5J4VA54_9EUKA|nr:MAG: hypothetical protein EZS28_025121 [Streblomastix strix]